jgi:TRAP-type mannitol/chloroaromatic compound transport system permease small subunit
LIALLKLSRRIDWLTERIGRMVIWLLLAAVVVSAANAFARYFFGMGSNAFLEAQWYMYSAMFLIGAGYVYLHDQHVRIDVVAGRFSRKAQVWVDIVGIVIFLIPLSVFIIWTSMPLVIRAFETMEVSANHGGLLRWPLFALLPLGFALLIMQCVSEFIKRLGFVTGYGPDPHAKPETPDDVRLREDLEREIAEREAAEAKAAEGGKS